LLGRLPSGWFSDRDVWYPASDKPVVMVRWPAAAEAAGYCGDFYGQIAGGRPIDDAISVPGLLRLLAALAPGITEVACHPTEAVAFETMYRSERLQELEVLCDARVLAALRDQTLQLCAVHDVPAVTASGGSPRLA
jgi:hypothetical protein